MKNTYTFILLAVPFMGISQGLVNNGAIIKVATGVDFRVDNGNITNQNSGTIDNSGKIYLDGNFDQNTAAAYSGSATSWLWFENSIAVQTINAGTVPRLRVENGNVLQLLADLVVSTDVDFMNNGNIRLGNFNLLTNNATLSNYGVSGYVITNGTGTLQRTMNSGDVKVFPVGNSSYNPATITNAGTTDDFQMRVEDVVYDYGTMGTPEVQGIVNRTWLITETVAGGSNSDITVEWDQTQELPTFDRTQSVVAHWDGAQWEFPGSTSPATNMGGTRWSQTRLGQTTFSPFAVEDFQEELPIELLSFDATRISSEQVKLDWATATEINNAGFDIERMLDNETEFKKVGFIEGYGNSTTTVNYGFYDGNAYPKISYYRLRQLDFDGTVSFSEIRAVAGVETDDDSAILIYPNPSKGNVNVRFGDLSAQQTSARVRVLDMRGVVAQEFEVAAAPYQSFAIDAYNLPSAAYLVELRMNTGEQKTLRFIRE